MKTNSPFCFAENNHTYFYFPFRTFFKISLSTKGEDSAFRKPMEHHSSLTSCSLWLSNFPWLFLLILNDYMQEFSAISFGLLKFPKIYVRFVQCRFHLTNLQVLLLYISSLHVNHFFCIPNVCRKTYSLWLKCPFPLSHHSSTYSKEGCVVGKMRKDLPTSASVQGNLSVGFFFILADFLHNLLKSFRADVDGCAATMKFLRTL